MQMKAHDERHYDVGNGGFNNLEPEIYEDSNGVVSEDGNTVDREQEMAKDWLRIRFSMMPLFSYSIRSLG
jgi:flagellar basal body rod protein FlgB